MLRKKKKKEVKKQQVHVRGGGIVQSLTTTILLPFNFSPNWGDRILVVQGRKHLDPTNFPSSHSLQLNTHKINFLSPIFYPPCFTPTKWTLRVYLVGVKIRRMENNERKIQWKMLFSIVWLRKENKRDRNQGRKFSLPAPLFLSSQIERKMGREKWCEMNFTQIPSQLPLIHDLMTFAFSHTYHFTFSQHNKVQVFFSPFFFLFFYVT